MTSRRIAAALAAVVLTMAAACGGGGAPADPGPVPPGQAAHITVDGAVVDIQVDGAGWQTDDLGDTAWILDVEWFDRSGTYNVNPLYWRAVTPDGRQWGMAITGLSLPLIHSQTIGPGQHIRGDLAFTAPANTAGTVAQLTVGGATVTFQTDQNATS